MNCTTHPAVAASAVCSACDSPICGSCTHIVKAQNVCPTCAPQLRNGIPIERPAVSIPASASSDLGQPAPSNTYGVYGQANGPSVSAPPRLGLNGLAEESNEALAKARREDKANLLKGIIVGTIVGLIGNILTLELLFYAHFGLAYIYIGVGYAIGAGVWHFTNRGGPQLAFTSVGIMLVTLAIAHVVYAVQFLGEAQANGLADVGATVIDAFPIMMSTFSPMHWVCIAIGVAACGGAAGRQPA